MVYLATVCAMVSTMFMGEHGAEFHRIPECVPYVEMRIVPPFTSRTACLKYWAKVMEIPRTDDVQGLRRKVDCNPIAIIYEYPVVGFGVPG